MASPLMASPVKETKAQKTERLKRALNPWEGLEEIRRFALLNIEDRALFVDQGVDRWIAKAGVVARTITAINGCEPGVRLR